MPTVSKKDIHAHLIAALSSTVISHGALSDVPLNVSIANIGDLAVYAFTLTSPPGGRPASEYKIQLISPGQQRDERGHLSIIGSQVCVLAGWSREHDVFVLWDAYAHETFSYSQNVQVKGEAVWLAQLHGLYTYDRHLRTSRQYETVIACRADRIADGLRVRVRDSAWRLLGGVQ